MVFANQSFGFLKLFKLIFGWLLISIFISLYSIASLAQTSNPSGLELPRFASTHSKPINVRVGPGKKYDIAWIYVKSGIAVEIINEFDTWRKIRDFDGQEGWIHQSLLSGRRTGFINIAKNEQIDLFSKSSKLSEIRAKLGAQYPIKIKQCDGVWCEIEVSFKKSNGKETSLSGFVEQQNIWGTYKNEKFD